MMTKSTNVSVIEAIATANPELSRSQATAADFMEKVESIPAPIRNRIRAIYQRSGIDKRYSCVQDYDRPVEDFTFYPKNWRLEPEPSTSQRNSLYKETAIPLGLGVAQDAIEKAAIDKSEITHIITVSCTGFFAPGLDIELCGQLGLRDDVERIHIGFMGCYAAFNALKTAHAFCQSKPDAVVLIVCLELCTLHFQVSDTLEKAIINSLFSDGAAAAILRSSSRADAAGKFIYSQGMCMLDEDTRGHMTWEVGDTGFNMGLSKKVPEAIARMLPVYIEKILARAEIGVGDVDFWAIHPGGRAVVEKAVEILHLSKEDVHDSMEVLRLYGNMSSPTILFVLKRHLEAYNLSRNTNSTDTGGMGVALAFGPGLTIEGCLIEKA